MGFFLRLFNTLGFKYNHSKFIRKMIAVTEISNLGLDVIYTKFKGYSRPYWCNDRETLVENINRRFPELKLKERYESWRGINYNFVVMEMHDSKNNIEYAIAYTTLKAHSYILSKSKGWIKTGIIEGDFRTRKRGFLMAFNSWKGVKRIDRLEKYFYFFTLEKSFKEKDDVWRYADKVLDSVYNGEYNNIERTPYTRTINKWKNEELLFNTVRKFLISL